MCSYLVDVDSEAGGREAQQSLQARGPRHQPSCPRTHWDSSEVNILQTEDSVIQRVKSGNFKD